MSEDFKAQAARIEAYQQARGAGRSDSNMQTAGELLGADFSPLHPAQVARNEATSSLKYGRDETPRVAEDYLNSTGIDGLEGEITRRLTESSERLSQEKLANWVKDSLAEFYRSLAGEYLVNYHVKDMIKRTITAVDALLGKNTPPNRRESGIDPLASAALEKALRKRDKVKIFEILKLLAQNQHRQTLSELESLAMLAAEASRDESQS